MQVRQLLADAWSTRANLAIADALYVVDPIRSPKPHHSKGLMSTDGSSPLDSRVDLATGADRSELLRPPPIAGSACAGGQLIGVVQSEAI